MLDASEVKVDLYKLVGDAFNASPQAVGSMVHHGMLKIDGHVMQPQWMRGQWTEAQLHGRMVETPMGQRRILGSRLVKDAEQLELGDG